MKKHTLIPVILASFGLLLTILPVHAGDPIPINPDEELLIVVHDNVMPRLRDGWTQDRMENERFHEFKAAIEEAIRARNYDGPFKVVRFAANLPKASQILNIYIYRWEQGLETFGPNIAVEFAMEAVLQVGGSEFGLGSFTARETHTSLSGPQAEDFRPAARRAIDQMIEYYVHAINRTAD